jgi:uncharacterized protein YgiM (DUF1202 family)
MLSNKYFWRISGVALVLVMSFAVFKTQNDVSQADLLAEGTVVTAMGNVRIREAPSVSAARLGMIGWGETAILQTVDESGAWYLINYNGLVGWSAGEWFRTANSALPALTVIVEDTVAPTVASPTGVTVRALGNVRIRELPRITSTRISLIGWGEQAPLLDVDPTGAWYKIEYRGIIGWAASTWFQTVSGDASTITPQAEASAATSIATTARATGNVRIRNAPSFNGERVGLVPWGAVVNVIALDPTQLWYQIEYEGVTGWTFKDWYRVNSGDVGSLITQATTVNSPSGVAVRPLGNLRLRARPSLNGEQIGLIGWGSRVPLLEIDASGNWYKIEYNGVVGWSSAAWFEVIEGSLDAFRPVAASSAVTAQALGNVKIRDSAGFNGARLGFVPWGGLVNVTAVDASGTWYQVTYEGITGWTFADWYQIRSGDVTALFAAAGLR